MVKWENDGQTATKLTENKLVYEGRIDLLMYTTDKHIAKIENVTVHSIFYFYSHTRKKKKKKCADLAV